MTVLSKARTTFNKAVIKESASPLPDKPLAKFAKSLTAPVAPPIAPVTPPVAPVISPRPPVEPPVPPVTPPIPVINELCSYFKKIFPFSRL